MGEVIDTGDGVYDATPMEGQDGEGVLGLLVGAPGQEFVASMLSTKDPQSAVNEVQKAASLPERCVPLLQLLDQLGVARAESHQYILQYARRILLSRIDDMSPDKLNLLLESSFAFIGIPDLRIIPLTVLSRLQPVPTTFLKQLSQDPELFSELPSTVQRQVWELDKNLLQQHALPKVSEFIQESPRIMRAYDMAECLLAHYQRKSGVGAGAAPVTAVTSSAGPAVAASAEGDDSVLARPPRGKIRRSSQSLQELVKMVGQSLQVYKGIVQLCIAKFRDSEASNISMQEASLCTLRSQLLMALHDNGATELCRTETCHKLAWTLDACLKDHLLDERRLKELNTFFQLYDNTSRGDSKRRKVGSGRAMGVDGEDAESAGGLTHSSEEPARLLAEAGMVLRDPSTLHLLLTAAIWQLEHCVDGLKLPADSKDLLLVTRLAQLALSARPQLREKRYSFPEPSSLLVRTFYPIICEYIADSKIAKLQRVGPREVPPNPVNDELVDIVKNDEVARSITMVYTLDRMMADDTHTAGIFLATLGAALTDISHKAHSEWSAFAYSLCRRLRSMFEEGKLAVKKQLWGLAFEGVLQKLVDTDHQVHEQVLSLLLQAAPEMSQEVVINCIKRAVKETRRNRRRWKKARGREDGSDPSASAAPPPGLEDSYLSIYTALAKKFEGRLTEENCPDLFALINSQP